ncbi:lycopene cyclase domain-containing protein [Aureivirga sp. CE67]|uniref:lycopene cyclase domain-containing protein n=1 Tax=Aureivirga sp. CE67 TaxID=1788983 RepID=UPI0018C9B47A|nr:lycopene cyclase domain-containing protein [Aureivirga sp. CE67]
MTHWLYLALNLGSISIPLLYSFEKKMYFIKNWKKIFVSTTIVATFFLIWDAIFTAKGVWGFNPDYYLGFKILKMPIEEWLFFFCIPYASIFIHYALKHFKPKLLIPIFWVKFISVILIFLSVNLIVLNYNKAYTLIDFSVFLITILLGLLFGIKILQRFFIAFLIILIPFFIVNGILTGSFIEAPVVWYDNSQNLGIRIFTIPVEDTAYAFSMLFLNILIFEKLKTR